MKIDKDTKDSVDNLKKREIEQLFAIEELTKKLASAEKYIYSLEKTILRSSVDRYS